VKPTGAANCSASGFATIVAVFRTDGVAKGSASFASWATPTAALKTIAAERNDMTRFVFIASVLQLRNIPLLADEG